MMTKYDFVNDLFTTYEPVKTSKVELNLPLFDDPIDISSWASGVSPSGIPIAKGKEPEVKEPVEEPIRYTMTNDYTQENSIQQSTEIKDKDKDKENSQKVPDLDISFEELLKQEGIHARITSGYRPGATTSSGKVSHHSKEGGAYDVVPTKGTFEDLREEIYGNPRIVAWLKNKNWGILEETTDVVKRKTGATGNHWHFGPDKSAVAQFNYNLSTRV